MSHSDSAVFFQTLDLNHQHLIFPTHSPPSAPFLIINLLGHNMWDMNYKRRQSLLLPHVDSCWIHHCPLGSINLWTLLHSLLSTYFWQKTFTYHMYFVCFSKFTMSSMYCIYILTWIFTSELFWLTGLNTKWFLLLNHICHSEGHFSEFMNCRMPI